jgi:hypothetical protein
MFWLFTFGSDVRAVSVAIQGAQSLLIASLVFILHYRHQRQRLIPLRCDRNEQRLAFRLHRSARRLTSRRKHALMAALFVVSAFPVNYALELGVPMPLHIIIRSVRQRCCLLSFARTLSLCLALSGS